MFGDVGARMKALAHRNCRQVVFRLTMAQKERRELRNLSMVSLTTCHYSSCYNFLFFFWAQHKVLWVLGHRKKKIEIVSLAHH